MRQHAFAIALALRTGSSIWMLEEVVADASIPVDAEADAEDAADFRRFLDAVSPAELVRQIRRAQPEAEAPPQPESNAEGSRGEGDDEASGGGEDTATDGDPNTDPENTAG